MPYGDPDMNRRHFIQRTAGTLMAGATVSLQASGSGKVYARHLPAIVTGGPELRVPEGLRLPFGWEAASVAEGSLEPLILKWPDLPATVTPSHFRITAALDERDEKQVEVILPDSGRIIGIMELRFFSQFQIHEMPLTPQDVRAIRTEGLALRLIKGSDFEILIDGEGLPDALKPHLMIPGTADPRSEYFRRMGSLASLQQFGWMEGCVLDGLLDLSTLPGHADLRQVARDHLALYIRNNQLVYDDPRSRPSDGKIDGIESTLPFAALAQLEPDSPLLDLVIAFWKKRTTESGAVQDGSSLSSEGAYTIGYPMATIARIRHSEDLMQQALTQVRIRQKHLFNGNTFWRTFNDGTHLGNRNWARGVAWQILGLAKTLGVAGSRKDVEDLIESFRDLAAWISSFQREDGLWSVFIDEQHLAPDTAGSAGIATALALGVNHGWLDSAYRSKAQSTLEGLTGYLTADGFLGGVSQSNKGGEGLQRGNYRTIFQMGMGLKGQLITALESK